MPKTPEIKVPVSGERWARVDPEDLPKVLDRVWSYARGYASNKPVGLMHRFILGLGPHKPGDPVVDHVNHDRLDNRRGNLRVVSQRDNMRNRLPAGVPSPYPQDYAQVLLYPDERKVVDEAADRARLPRSTWMRLVCVDAARRGLSPVIPLAVEVPHGD